jgi:hypothetical protein
VVAAQQYRCFIEKFNYGALCGFINIWVAIKDNNKDTRKSNKLNLSVWVRRQKHCQNRQVQPPVTKQSNENGAQSISVVEISNYRAESPQESLISELIEIKDEVNSHGKRCYSTNNHRNNCK